MGSREEYTAALKCPKCGRAGKAEMSDRKSYKIEPDYGTTVDRVPEGFEIIQTATEPYAKYDVICADCRVSALNARPKKTNERQVRDIGYDDIYHSKR
jgi:hypothetical protein